MADNLDEARRKEAAEGVDLDALLEEDLLREQAGNTGEVIRKALDETRLLVTAVAHDVPILKKVYVELLHVLTDEVRKTNRELNAITR